MYYLSTFNQVIGESFRPDKMRRVIGALNQIRDVRVHGDGDLCR